MINRHSSSLYPSIVRERFLSWDVLTLQSHQYNRHMEACLRLALISLEHYTLQIDPHRTTNVGPESFTLDCFELLLLSSSSLWNPSAFHLSRKRWHRPPSNGWLWAISEMNSQKVCLEVLLCGSKSNFWHMPYANIEQYAVWWRNVMHKKFSNYSPWIDFASVCVFWSQPSAV